MDQRKFVNRCTMKRRPSNFASSSTAPFIPTYFRLLNGGESIGSRVNNVEIRRDEIFHLDGRVFLSSLRFHPSFFRLKTFHDRSKGRSGDESRMTNVRICVYIYIYAVRIDILFSRRVFLWISLVARKWNCKTIRHKWRISRDAHFEVSRKEFWFVFPMRNLVFRTFVRFLWLSSWKEDNDRVWRIRHEYYE